jgi:type IV pilus assembly protein PilB
MSERLAEIRSRALADELKVPYVELGRRSLDPDAVRLAPLEVLERLVALPYAVNDDGVVSVAFAAPSPEAVAELERISGKRVAVALARADEVNGLLHELALGGTLRDDALQIEGELVDDAPAVRIVNDFLRRAIESRASDIHLVPDADCVHVRLRIDGVVQEHGRVASEDAPGVVSRLKVLAKLDVAERRRPQDGRFSVRTTTGKIVDLRVTLLPTIAGEGVVLRLLEKTRNAPSLTDLGLENAMQMELERIVHRSIGALLVTGPTGSGKSTTLHGALMDIARPEKTVITIEDPVEYELSGAYQIQVNAAVGLTFATALRTVLRGDPDVIMVGEIRDAETAVLALGGALAGHFVLSTLHTNDALSTVTRLAEMGVERYVLSAGLSGVLGQRLARRLCLFCREPYRPAPDVLELLYPDGHAGEDTVFFRSIGCPYCNSGYRGRVGIFQLLTIDEQLRALIAGGASHESLAAAAEAGGMSSMRSDGLAKVEAGIISLEELHRVVPL